ncbi:replication factor C subunit 4, partial [Conglomerata obtusa]
FECKVENYKYLKIVGEKEGINKSDEFYGDLFRKCSYDLRRSLNVLQGIAPFIEKADVNEFVGIVPNIYVSEFLEIKIENLEDFVDRFIRSGYGFIQFVKQIGKNFVCANNNINFYQVLSEYEAKAVNGCSNEMMLLGLCCKKIEILG